jgi:hypothetical protein
MGRRWGVALVILALAFVACSDDDSDDTAASTTTGGSAPSRSTPTVSSAPPSTAGSDLTPEQCGQALFDAWAAGNESAAPPCASAAAVQQIFAEPYSAGYQGPNCDGAAGSVFCTWTTDGPALVMEIRNTTGGLPVEVISVTRTEAM